MTQDMGFSFRVQNLKPEGAYHMLSLAEQLEAQGKEIIHLEIGQPDFPTFEHIAQAGVRAIREGYTRYTPAGGMPLLREAIARHASRRYGLEITPEQVVVGPGAKAALFFPTLALVNPGDAVLYPDPGFPTYQAMIEVAGGIAVPLPLNEDHRFWVDVEILEEKAQALKESGHKVRMLILNSPSNPTGSITPYHVLQEIARLAKTYDFWVLSDEIYSRLTYEAPAPSIVTLPEMQSRTIICDGFSKTYAMTGWRLGYGIMPAKLAEKVELLLTHAVGCTASFTQVAGIEALEGAQDQVDRCVEEYRRRRDLLVTGLNAIPGVCCLPPEGAFYVFPNISSFGRSSEWMAQHLLKSCGVALLPGTAFGSNGEGYLRLCFANSIENLQKALERLGEALTKINAAR